MRNLDEAVKDLSIRMSQAEAFITYLKTKIRVEKTEPEQLFAEEVRDNNGAV